MKLNLGRMGDFIPTWEGNDKLPENEQIKVSYTRISGQMSSRVVRVSSDETGYIDYPYIVQKCVTKIDNLKDENNGNIDTAQKLLDNVGTAGLVTEVGLHILNDSKLPDGDQKKNTDSVALVQ